MTTALEIRNLKRSFQQGEARIDVLRGVDLSLERGEIVALLGPSGAGKSTLLQAAGLLEGGFTGDLLIDGELVSGLGDRERTALRARKLGFVYQFHHLLPDFTALENVIMPQLIAGQKRDEAAVYARELLEGLGLAERTEHRPAQLSGGEQQRVAVARALANQPVVVLADEPTGNLDEATADRVFDAFLELVRRHSSAALVATHNRKLAARMDRVVQLHEGVLHPVDVSDVV